MTDIVNTKTYIEFLNSLKKEIQHARLKAHLAVNKELILLYWRIGKEILERKKDLGWGSKVIEQLSQDLRHTFPEMKGLSLRNLVYMQTFASSYPDFEFTQALPAQITWYHNQTILDKVQDPQKRIFYIQNTIENGWSRNILVIQIDSNLYERQGKALTNFKDTLPSPVSDLAQQLFKNEYNFEFLNLSKEVHEKVIERSLINHIRDFLLELGSGFSFLGSQHKVTLAGEDFYIDLLMYHVRLRAYVVIELKSGKFKPEYAGKLSFYLTAIDKEVKLPEDKPTIGLLLCQSSNKLMVEYCLSDIRRPVGVSEYRTTTEIIPKELETMFPTPEQFQHLLNTLPVGENDEK